MLRLINVLLRDRRRICSSQSLHFLVCLQLVLTLVHVPSCGAGVQKQPSSREQDDFAEFEEEEEDVVRPAAAETPQQQEPPPITSEAAGSRSSKPAQDSDDYTDDATVENDEEDVDEDEIFERIAKSDKETGRTGAGGKAGDGLKITDIPAHLRGNWDSYYMEILLAVGICVYFLNYWTGKSKNESIANKWLEVHRQILESNFSLVGDDGKKEIEENGFIKESESVFLLWCTGRVSIEGMLLELRLWKRQDLLSVVSKMMRPVKDQAVIKINLTDNGMDNFVFALATKKTAARLLKEFTDLATYTPERKSVEKFGLNRDKFVLLNEIPEISAAIMDTAVVNMLNQFDDAIDYIHISDQFSGPKPSEYDPQPLKMPDVKKVAYFAFNLSPSGKGMTTYEGIEEKKSLMQMVFYIVDKLRKLRLSKEGKIKSEKNRQKVEESFLKATHFQRQEAAQLKREERKRQEKEKMLAEDDPEKQRKWEEREYRKEMKRKTPKMKQLKVKAM